MLAHPVLPLTLSVQQDAQRGRFLVAARDIAAGTTLLAARPYAFAAIESHRKRVCAHCMAWQSTGRFTVNCARCDQVYYCSDACRERACAAGHDRSCALLRKIATHAADRHVKSLLLVLLAVLQNRARERTGAQPSADAAPDDVDPAVLEAPGDFAEFQLLQDHLSEWTPDELQDWRKTEKLMRSLLLADGLLDSHEDDQLLRFVSAIESNCFGVWTDKGETYGRALYLRASYFNHSCEPNCESFQSSGVMSIVTKEDVKQGTELTIKYIDVAQPVSTRREALQRDYRFLCACPRCTTESSTPSRRAYTYARSVNHSQKNRKPPPKPPSDAAIEPPSDALVLDKIMAWTV